MTGGLMFELFGRKTETRGLQRRLSLAGLDSHTPPGVARMILRSLLSKHLDQPMQGQLSGGLLFIANKASVA
jgi:hypothetical protein